MKVELDFRKSVSENAAHYYELAKKAKRKIPNLMRAIEETKKEIKLARERQDEARKKKLKVKRERDWYEKFHWFFSSDGLLVLGGRDARSNQVLVRRYMDDKDLFFHADIKGGSVVVVKSGGAEVPERTRQEAAQFAASFSRAFSLGLAAVTVYSVRPEQVRTAAKAGEFLPKGGFVLIGERDWYRSVPIKVAVSYDKEKHRVVSGPESAISKYGQYVVVVPGRTEKGEIAKKIKKLLENWFGEEVDLDDVLRMLPPGKADIKYT